MGQSGGTSKRDVPEVGRSVPPSAPLALPAKSGHVGLRQRTCDWERREQVGRGVRGLRNWVQTR